MCPYRDRKEPLCWSRTRPQVKNTLYRRKKSRVFRKNPASVTFPALCESSGNQKTRAVSNCFERGSSRKIDSRSLHVNNTVSLQVHQKMPRKLRKSASVVSGESFATVSHGTNCSQLHTPIPAVCRHFEVPKDRHFYGSVAVPLNLWDRRGRARLRWAERTKALVAADICFKLEEQNRQNKLLKEKRALMRNSIRDLYDRLKQRRLDLQQSCEPSPKMTRSASVPVLSRHSIPNSFHQAAIQYKKDPRIPAYLDVTHDFVLARFRRRRLDNAKSELRISPTLSVRRRRLTISASSQGSLDVGHLTAQWKSSSDVRKKERKEQLWTSHVARSSS
eukprot:1013600_1